MKALSAEKRKRLLNQLSISFAKKIINFPLQTYVEKLELVGNTYINILTYQNLFINTPQQLLVEAKEIRILQKQYITILKADIREKDREIARIKKEYEVNENYKAKYEDALQKIKQLEQQLEEAYSLNLPTTIIKNKGKWFSANSPFNFIRSWI